MTDRALILCLAIGSLMGSACASAGAEAPLQRFEFEQPQMGVPFRIVLYAPNRATGSAAAEAAFARVAKLNQILSNYETDSELSQLSRWSDAGPTDPVVVSPELWFVLERAQKLSEQTEGAFDVTIGPLANLWRKARRVKALPDPKLLAEARDASGFRKLRLDPQTRTVQLLTAGMRLDLGGIAKGYAVDEAMKVLRSHGITRALVGGDGDILAGDPPPGAIGWNVAVAGLDAANAPSEEFLVLTNRAVSTSGDLSQRLEIEGRRYSHIIDPRTGIGLTDRSLVTVIAPDSITADSLATAVSVLGPAKGLALIEAFPDVEVRILRKPAETIESYVSKGFTRARRK